MVCERIGLFGEISIRRKFAGRVRRLVNKINSAMGSVSTAARDLASKALAFAVEEFLDE
jgi:hypothetical protein